MPPPPPPLDEVVEEPTFSERRQSLVRRALDAWKKQLVDLGGRNNLLYYRDPRVGALDLRSADTSVLEVLYEGRSVRLSRLFPDPADMPDALKRARATHKKAQENYEERGVETLFLAYGMATWSGTLTSSTPRAPILLRPAVLQPRGAAQDDFDIVLTGEMELSSTLLHFLKTEFKCEPDETRLELNGVIDTKWELDAAAEWFAGEASAVPGFTIEPRAVIGNFSYMKLPMVRDLEEAYEILLEHDLVAALAGDDEAREALRERYDGVEVSLTDPDHTPPSDEFLILDADSSQNYAINSVLGGQDLIVRGPPGTGKSQTIANLIATLSARGQKVLFVAEKRAAIDAVTKRLNHVGLGDLVFDLHGGVAGRRMLAQSLARSLELSGATPLADLSVQHADLVSRREQLNERANAFQASRPPWGLSVFETQVELMGTPEPARSSIRLRGESLVDLDGDSFHALEQNLTSLIGLGGLTLETSLSPWARATVTSPDEARDAFETTARLREHTLPTTLATLSAGAQETGLRSPANATEMQAMVEVWESARETLEVFSEEIFRLPLKDVCAALAPSGRGGLASLGAAIRSSDYRRTRKTVKKLLRQRRNRQQTLSAAEAALDQIQVWGRLCERQSWPLPPSNLEMVAQTANQLLAELDRLSKYLPKQDLRSTSMTELDPLFSRLLADQPTLAKLPEIFRLEQSLISAGLGELIVELRNRQLSPDLCRFALRHVWLSSILERVRLEDPLVGVFDANQMRQTVAEYQQLDAKHIETTPDRVRRGWAERVFDARSRLKDEEALIRKQAGLKRRLMPFRSLVTSSLNLLLELKPCWAMSPLVVSQVLPARRLFDVVIFDEASQVRPADAVPAIARGERVVLAGDKKQLPPSAFFLSSAEEEEEAEEEAPPELAGTSGFESILENLEMLVPFRMLTWHYRSHDERLIAFSNANFYDHGLTTFPGSVDYEPVRHVAVPFTAGQVGQEESVSAEVDRVVELILEHARQAPDETLGVIAMGIKHANRLEEELRRRLADEEGLDEFFAETNEERFFVKNLERVQGDERDAIILSVGYGKSPDGRMLYRFGPINVEGGERRLNVAVTRARKRMTTVSSFSCDDMDLDRLRAEGARILRSYLRYAESGATNFGEHAMLKPALNAFEVDVRDTLARHGVPVTPQLGVSGYWIDFAAKHPIREGKYVLAIECDGATYHSSQTARDRDRLRQEQLQRLGWRFHRIWSADWFSNKEAAVEGVLEAYKRAIEEVDSGVVHHSGGTSENSIKSTPRRIARPPVRRGRKIDEYTQYQLVSVVRWIDSDTLLRTDEEVLQEVMHELGFRRRGTKIVERIREAIRSARRDSGV